MSGWDHGYTSPAGMTNMPNMASPAMGMHSHYHHPSMEMGANVNAGPVVSPAMSKPTGCCSPTGGYTSASAILVLFILLVIISRTIRV